MVGLSAEDVSDSPKIPQSLCRKAVDHNDQLTRVERILFLSRLDLAGKTLADPKSLSNAELDRILGRPPPAVLSANIKLLTGLNTIAEVMRDFWSPDRTEKLSYDTLECITTQWWTPQSDDIYGLEDFCEEDMLDSVVDAASELAASLRPEEAAFERAAAARFLSIDCKSDENAGEILANQGQIKSAEEWLKERERRLQEHKEEIAQLRNELEIRMKDELKMTTEEDVKAMAELRQRMEIEIAKEKAEEAIKRQQELEGTEDNEEEEDSNSG